MSSPAATRIIVFAKAPQPGRVKTRLARSIGGEAAAELASRMLEHTLVTAAAARLGAVELCCAPSVEEPQLVAAARRVGAQCVAQGEGDLGARMARAFERGLAVEQRVLIIGTDCPDLTAARLRAAADGLRRPREAVFYPALDGGYVLIGLSRYRPELFAAMPWSSAEVMPRTRERLRAAGVEWWEGEPLADIDRFEDLHHLPAGWWPPSRVAAETVPLRGGGGG